MDGGPAWGSLNQNVELTRIPRASSITAIDANIESSTLININRASSSFTHTITYSFAGLTGTIATKTAQTSIGWTIPSSFYAKIPNAKTGTVTLTCTTYSGDTAIGTSNTEFTITASEEKCKPTISATLIDSNATTVALTGDNSKLIKYKSTAKVTPTATAKNSATIKKITVNGVEMSGSYIEFKNVQSETFKAVATDSRGYPNEKELKPTIIPYIPLSANIEVYRPIDTGSEIKVKYDGKFFNGNFGTSTNTLTMTWKCTTKQDTSKIVKQGTLTPTKSGNTFSGDVSLGTTYSYQQDYIFTFTIKDKLTTLTPAIPLKRGIPYFDWGVDANGKNYFNVNGEIYRNNENILHKHSMTIRPARHTMTFSQSWVGTKISNMSIFNQTGNKLSFEQNSIKIGKGVSKIAVSGAISWSCTAQTDRVLTIHKNEDEQFNYYNQMETGNYQGMGIPYFILSVTEGDLISLRAVVGAAGCSSEILSGYLSVHVVE